MRGWLHKRQHRAAHVPAWPACKALGVDRRDAPSVDEGQRRFASRLAPSQADLPGSVSVSARRACRRVGTRSRSRPVIQPEVRTAQRAERACAEARRRTNGHAASVGCTARAPTGSLPCSGGSGNGGARSRSGRASSTTMRALRQTVSAWTTPAWTPDVRPQGAPHPRRSAASARELLQEKKDFHLLSQRASAHTPVLADGSVVRGLPACCRPARAAETVGVHRSV